MTNQLNRFYVFSKLTTTLVLFGILVFLVFLFASSYQAQKDDIKDFSEIKSLSQTITSNEQNIKLFSNNQKNQINAINQLKETIKSYESNDHNKELLIEIKRINKENEDLKYKINFLTEKLNSIIDVNKSSLNEKNIEDNQSIKNLVIFTKLKLENGDSTINEIELLQKLISSQNHLPHLEKLYVLSNKKFLGLKRLEEDFGKLTKTYLGEFFLKNNKNILLKYLSYFVTIEPNNTGNTKNKTIKQFIEIKTAIENKNFVIALNKLNLIPNNQEYFKNWINDIEYYIEFEKHLEKLII